MTNTDSGPAGLAEPAGPAGPATTDAQIATISDDLERIAAHLVPFLKSSYAETLERLNRAERLLAARRERPAIAGMHELLCSLRRLGREQDVREFVEDGIVGLLDRLGYREFGAAGDAYDPLRHEAVGGQTDRGRGRLVRVHRRGLVCYDDVIIRAMVEVEPTGGELFEPIALPNNAQEGGI